MNGNSGIVNIWFQETHQQIEKKKYKCDLKEKHKRKGPFLKFYFLEVEILFTDEEAHEEREGIYPRN